MADNKWSSYHTDEWNKYIGSANRGDAGDRISICGIKKYMQQNNIWEEFKRSRSLNQRKKFSCTQHYRGGRKTKSRKSRKSRRKRRTRKY